MSSVRFRWFTKHRPLSNPEAAGITSRSIRRQPGVIGRKQAVRTATGRAIPDEFDKHGGLMPSRSPEQPTTTPPIFLTPTLQSTE